VLRRDFPLDAASHKMLEDLYSAGRITARGFDRVVRLAWTLADLQSLGRPTVELTHQAYQLRAGEPLTDLADARSLKGTAR
jgi:magnesium chelatase family protein